MDKLNTLIHLYETAHSGFYGENPSETVNLVPKTWTRYTVTDGNWMSPKTVEPLVLRDIYLANKIDEVDDYLGDFYKAGRHIIIDKTTNTISLSTYEYKYVFNNGLMYDEYYVYSNLPETYGGLDNKLYFSGDKISYNFVSGNTINDYIDTVSCVSAWGGLTGDTIRYFPDNANVVIVTSAELDYDDRSVDAGGYKIGSANYWDFVQNKRVDEIYNENPPEPTGHPDASGVEYNVFNPADKRKFEFNSDVLSGGSNYIETIGQGPGQRTITMVPDNVLFIYD